MIKYPQGSAASLMIHNIPVVDPDIKVSQLEEVLYKKIADYETINYVYIVNEKNNLIGIISIKELFRSPKNKFLKDLMIKDIVSVSSKVDKEKIALLALEKNIKAMPVVSRQGEFLGVVPSDVILQILHEESLDNLLRLSGVSQKSNYQKNIFSLSLFDSLRNRLPWLIFGLLGGLLVATVVSFFEGLISHNLILVSFIPLVIYMSDAVSSQMQAFIIRDIAFNHNLNFSKYLIRHSRVVLSLSFLIACLLYIFSFAFYQSAIISLVLAFSLFLAIMTSLLSGLIIPYAFSRMKLDPADASGPIATIIQDFLSVLVYFYVAYLFL